MYGERRELKCPECDCDNRNGVKFCEECGAKMELACPHCGSTIPLGKKFCGECGHDLRNLKEARPIDYDQPKSYTPKFLADKILTTRSSMEGERKLVTVLFADVANYTSISEKLDPEDVHKLMDGCFQILMNEVHKVEGTINQFTGDGIMALFGAPVAHENHAQRACYAALSIQKAMGEYGEKVKTEFGRDFTIRIGLNSGPVIVGSIGDDLRMDYTAVGDTTNLASRLQSMAKPGSALVSEHTHRSAKDFFVFESLGKVEVKGREEPVDIFDLIKAGDVETRIDASVAKGLTKFVGRTREMVVLKEAYDKACSGSGQVLGIVGEAGVGKSRILLELKNAISEEEHTYLEGRCLHYGGSMPYLPVLDILKSYFDIKEETREPSIKKKIKEALRKLDEEIEDTPPALLELLSLRVEDEKYLQLGAQQRREITFEALRDLLIRVSKEKPLVLTVEDLHWIDRVSQEFLDYLIGWLPNTPILLILLYRPEHTHSWGSKSYYTQVSLDQLSTNTSAELVHAILEQGQVAPELRNLILGKAGGNPLFVEELTHSLLENGSIHRKDDQYVLSRKASEIEVPDTIQAIIAARLDRVEDNLKRIMQVASVIGREFAYRVLATITGLREELKASLLNLQGLEFIYEKQLFPELEYIFKHVLTQEVAYNSMLLKKREEFHEKIAIAIEEIYAERLEEFYELLAYHYLRSQNKEKAVDYLDLANQKAQKSNAMEEAKAYFDQAMELLDTLPDNTKNEERRISLLVNQANVFMMLLRTPEYYDLLNGYESVAAKIENPLLLGTFFCCLAQCKMTFGLFDQSIRTAAKAAELCEVAGNMEGVAYAHVVSVWSHLFRCEYSQVISLKEDVLRNMNDHFNLNVYVRTLGGAAMAYSGFGQWNKAVDEGQKAMRIAQEYSDNSMISWAAYILTLVYIYKGNLERAIEYGNLGVEKAPTLADKVWAQSGLSWAWCRSGEPEKGIEFLNTYVELTRAARFLPAQLNGMLWLCDGYRLAGDYAKARQTAEELVEVAGGSGMRTYLGLAHCILGVSNVESDPKQAAVHFKESIRILIETKSENSLAIANAAYGRLHRHQGRIEEAREYLTKALEIFERLGTLIEPDRVRQELAELS